MKRAAEPSAGRAVGPMVESAPESAPEPTVESQSPLLGIGSAARECGVSERSLRYYQEIGLLTPSARTPGGLRRYSEADVARVRRIRELQTLLGLNLDEIRVVINNDDRLARVRQEFRSTPTSEARRRELLQEVLAIHQATAATIDAKLTGLQRYRTEVERSAQRVRELLAELDTPSPEPVG